MRVRAPRRRASRGGAPESGGRRTSADSGLVDDLLRWQRLVNLTRLLDVRTWPDLATEAVLRVGGPLHGLDQPSGRRARERRRWTLRCPTAAPWPTHANGEIQRRH